MNNAIDDDHSCHLIQFNMAKLIPGKEEFEETLRYFRTKLGLLKIDVGTDHRLFTD